MAKKTRTDTAPPPEKMVAVKRFLRRWLGVEGLETPEYDTVLRLGVVFAVLAVVIRFVFWAYTGRNWEDAFITVLHSENFVNGLGLTHYLGEGEAPLHGFTSPLSVLVPLMGDLVHVGFGLSFIKIVSALAGGLTVLYAMAIAVHPKVKLPAPLTVLVTGYLAFEHHQILWGMAGMETQMTTLVLVISFYFAIAARPLALGVSLGFCMLARPDFAFWTVIAGVYVLMQYPRRLPAVVGAALAVYLPWVLFTTWYYGSPVPNTMVAKGLGYPLWTTWPGFDRTAGAVLKQLATRLTGSYEAGAVFQPLGPSFAGHGNGYRALIGDHGAICDFMIVMAILGALDALRKRQWVWLPVLLFVLVYAVYYVFFVALVFSWYLTPFAAMALLLSVRGLGALGGLLRAARLRTVVLGVLTLAYLACFVVLLPKTFATEREVQERVENQVRKQVGLFLGRVMEKNETVGTEPLGYLSYYSRRIVYDWPGLCSRKVVEYSRSHPREERTLLDMLAALRPDFLVLRLYEYDTAQDAPWLDEDYRVIASFEAPQGKDDALAKMNMDMGFLVLAKKTWRPEMTVFEGEALGVNPKHTRALNCVGQRLVRRGKPQEAAALYRKAIAAGPVSAETHCNLGIALNGLGDRAGAMTAFMKAVELDPKQAVALNNLGVCLLDVGELARGEKCLRASMQCDAKYVEPILNLADLAARQGNLAEGKRLFEEALKIEPGNAAAKEGIAKIERAKAR